LENKNLDVVLIIPAHNEATRIGAVLDEAIKARFVNEIIVVNDGSTDDTAKVAKEYNEVKVINCRSNGGKGAALKAGLDSADAKVFVFIDADLMGLKAGHIEDLIVPLFSDEELEMTVGKFVAGRVATNLSQSIVPQISGQRAFKKRFLEDMLDFSNSGYGVEVAFVRQAKRRQSKTKEVPLANVTHVMKEEKMGLHKGVLARLKMYWDMFFHLIKETKEGRNRF